MMYMNIITRQWKLSSSKLRCLPLCLFFLSLFGSATVNCVYYNTTAATADGKINVHLVPHSHDDVGWLKTIDQYYIGSNNSIQGACVENVLDSVVVSLRRDPNRKFIFAEQAFFQRWWATQNEQIQAEAKGLIKAGQLEFVNGGWCMHDEAAAHYVDMIDQTTLGHLLIKKQFNKVPRAGWQIDPFGHSAVQGYLLGAELGFESVHFARIDYQDRANRKANKSLEVIWQGSKTFGSSSQIFANAFPVHYSPPQGFGFEVSDGDSVPVQDNPLLFDYNVAQRVNDFVDAAIIQANVTRTNHIMWTMGDDFQYQDAETWFKQMDKLIHYVNKDGRVNALYSTPSIYTDVKNALNVSWPLKTDDYFPYADHTNAYWTGYFTSRAGLKGYVRSLSGYYLAARQLEFLAGRRSSGPNTYSLGDALGIAQHHDAITGTAKQHTTNDYAKRLSIGATEAEAVVTRGLSCLTSRTSRGCVSPKTEFSQCQLLNVSYCPPTEEDIPEGKSLVVVTYNPLGWGRTDIIKIPVNDDNLIVQDSAGNTIVSQYITLDHVTSNLRTFYVEAYTGKSPDEVPKYWLLFQASVPPLGWNTYFISKPLGKDHIVKRRKIYIPTVDGLRDDTIEIGPGNLKMYFSSTSGQLKRMFNSKSGLDVPMQQSYLWYGSSQGDSSDSQASGAYIFRPNGDPSTVVSRSEPLKVVRGPVVHEVHQQFSSWIYQVTRLYKDKEHAEVEFTIGPIPTEDGVGKEVITRVTADMATNKIFYTDSNGRDFLKRVRDYRKDWSLTVSQPVAGNYYPLNLGIFTKDQNSELSVLVDRAVGGASSNDGEIEIMLHRRMLFDDSRGVGEPLNETVCLEVEDKCEGLTVRGKYLMSIEQLGAGAQWRRTTGQEVYSPMILAFTQENMGDWTASHLLKGTVMDPNYSLPQNVALITLQELDDGRVLLRLAHLYEAGEDNEQSKLAQVELKKLFPGKTATMICIDNSEWMRNGDYSPTRFQAQADAVNLICGAKTQSNPENTVGVLTMSGKGVRVLVTPTTDLGKILACMHGLEVGGEMNLAAGIQVAQLALKHRQNKKQQQRIIVFVGSPVNYDKKVLETIGRKLKKNSVALDIVDFGEEEHGKPEKLEALLAAVNNNDSSHIVHVPAGPSALSDVLISTPIFTGDGEGGSGFAAAAAAAAAGGATGFDFGVDPNIDPELALALRVSMEEERARQEAAAKQAAEESSEQEKGGEQQSASQDATMTERASNPVSGDEKGTVLMDDENALLQKALAMSMDDASASNPLAAQDADMSEAAADDQDLALALQLSVQDSTGDTSGDADLSKLLSDQSFVSSILASLPGVDPNDPSVKDLLASMQSSQTESQQKKDEEDNAPKEDKQ